MRTLPLHAALCALLAGCAAAPAVSTESAGAPAATPGVFLVDEPDRGAPGEFTVAILENASFQHPRLEVAAQTTLVWWNVDDLVHSVVSDDGGFAGSGPIAPAEEFVRTFQTPGEYPYHCRYHPEMRGLLLVR
ncbi:MAG TPA: cupredoxin domain-containing protein [Candidatus Thermoplasmatota archaeon]|nr:cupredoxin domain-containing protein [Candidatus Thermoplasmatota archaeon]